MEKVTTRGRICAFGTLKNGGKNKRMVEMGFCVREMKMRKWR
jgi:hypothetical protein